MTSSAILILAAGSSSRMGRSKQLIRVNNKELLLNAVQTAVATKITTAVVLGSNEKKHSDLIAGQPVEIVVNTNWEKGMGNSLKEGLNYLLRKNPSLESLLIMVCDQPLLKTSHLLKLKSVFDKKENPIVASFYGGSGGVPAIFDKSLFPQIMTLPNEHGAKKIIQTYIRKTTMVDFPEGAIDIDTPGDLENFSTNTSSTI